MLQAFSAENRQDDFDWDQHYAAGFDALNMKLLTESETQEREADAIEVLKAPPVPEGAEDSQDAEAENVE